MALFAMCTNCFNYHEGNECYSISAEIMMCVVFYPSFCSLHALVLTLRKVSVTKYDTHGMFLTLFCRNVMKIALRGMMTWGRQHTNNIFTCTEERR